MAQILSLPLILIGGVLLALDRILDKRKVMQLDRGLSEFVQRFNPPRKPLFELQLYFSLLVLLFIVSCVISRTGITEQFLERLSEDDKEMLPLLPYSPFLFIFMFMVIVGFYAYYFCRHADDPKPWLKTLTYTLIFTLLGPVIFLLILPLTLIHLSFYPFVYPLKGILFLNNRFYLK